MRGIIYVIAGDQELPKLHMSIIALKRVSKLPIAIYAYLSDQGYNSLQQDHSVIRSTPPVTDLFKVSRYLKTGIHRITPFDETMYLDNDVISVRDPEWIFDLIPPSGIIFGSDAGKTVQDYNRYATPGLNLSDEISKQFNIKVDSKWRIWNGGVIAFNQKAYPFLESWHLKQLRLIKGLTGWTQRDQGTLIATAWEYNLQDNPVLPKTANFLHGLQISLNNEDWTIKKTKEPITNLHLCLSWGKPESRTWNKINYEVNGILVEEKKSLYERFIKPLGTKVMVIPYSDKHIVSPLRFIIQALELCEGYRIVREESCDNVCGLMSDYLHARHSFTSLVWVNDKIVIIDYNDLCNTQHCVLRKINWQANIGKPDLILKCQYRPEHQSYTTYPVKIIPFMYPTVNTHAPDTNYHLRCRDAFMENVKKNNFKYTLFARMAKHKPRIKICAAAAMIPDSEIKLIGMDSGPRQITTASGRLARDEYFQKLISARFSLDAAGNGDFTHRLVEGWAVGMPVIRPKLKNAFYVPIKPNVHYIECNPDGADLQEKIKYYSQHYNEALQIAHNGMEYYDKYCSREGIAKLFLEIFRFYDSAHLGSFMI
jgi:hypothetical protein